jgi:hypothetical protein
VPPKFNEADMLMAMYILQNESENINSSSVTECRVPGSGKASSSGGSHHPSKKTRRRVATVAQRRAANIRERRRMFNLNEAFDKLRTKVSCNKTNFCKRT